MEQWYRVHLDLLNMSLNRYHKYSRPTMRNCKIRPKNKMSLCRGSSLLAIRIFFG
jgi:hypothetical protein